MPSSLPSLMGLNATSFTLVSALTQPPFPFHSLLPFKILEVRPLAALFTALEIWSNSWVWPLPLLVSAPHISHIPLAPCAPAMLTYSSLVWACSSSPTFTLSAPSVNSSVFFRSQLTCCFLGKLSDSWTSSLWCPLSPVHFFNKHLLSICSVPGTVLDLRDTSVSKREEVSCPRGA